MLKIAITPSTSAQSRGLIARREEWHTLLLQLPKGVTELERTDRRIIVSRIEDALGSGLPAPRIDVSKSQAAMILKTAGISG